MSISETHPFRSPETPSDAINPAEKLSEQETGTSPLYFQDPRRSRRSRRRLWRQRNKGRRRRRKGKDLSATKRGKEARPCLVRNPWLKQTTTPRKKGERGESQATPLPPLVAGGSLSDGRSNGFSVAWRKEEGRRGFLFPLAGPESESLDEEGRKRMSRLGQPYGD